MTPFQITVKVASDEYAKALGDNAQSGREEIAKILEPVQSKQQLVAALSTIDHLLGSKSGAMAKTFSSAAPAGTPLPANLQPAPESRPMADFNTVTRRWDKPPAGALPPGATNVHQLKSGKWAYTLPDGTMESYMPAKTARMEGRRVSEGTRQRLTARRRVRVHRQAQRTGTRERLSPEEEQEYSSATEGGAEGGALRFGVFRAADRREARRPGRPDRRARQKGPRGSGL